MPAAVIVCGGLDFTDRALLYAALDKVLARHPDLTIIEGEARGADTMGREWAVARKRPCLRFPADWKRYGLSAGPRRNQQMLDHALKMRREGLVDVVGVVAFPTRDRGTAHTMRIAHKAGVGVWNLGIAINLEKAP
jgi:hypothetical protein